MSGLRKLPRFPTPRSLPTTAKRKPAPTPPPVPRSSGIEAHEYSPETGHLTVTYRGGRQYRYDGVDQETADALGSADSKGSFLRTSVIGKFTGTKIEP